VTATAASVTLLRLGILAVMEDHDPINGAGLQDHAFARERNAALKLASIASQSDLPGIYRQE